MTLINHTKTYYPIGQGCFYVEQLRNANKTITIVYDCGSFNLAHLEKEVKFSNITNIDYLIISHFHEDHINGLKYLKSKCQSIKNVIIPKLNQKEIYFYKESKNTVIEVLENIQNFFRDKGSKIIEVNENIEPTTIEEEMPDEISHHTLVPVLKDNQGKIIWTLKFYVDPLVYTVKENSKKAELIKELDKITDFEENKERLREIYKGISSNINMTTMSMASFPSENVFPLNYRFHFNHFKYASLLNGDTLLNSEDRIFRYVSHFNEVIGMKINFHVPHHGSHKNLLRPLTEFFLNLSVVSSGYENKYGHPSHIVIRKYLDSMNKIKVMTEYDKKIIEFRNYVA